MATVYTLKCWVCGKTFDSNNDISHYCSPVCKSKAASWRQKARKEALKQGIDLTGKKCIIRDGKAEFVDENEVYEETIHQKEGILKGLEKGIVDVERQNNLTEIYKAFKKDDID